MSIIRAIQLAVAASGCCTRCSGTSEDAFGACPLDGICPAPDYHERRANRLFDERICACWKEDGKPCLGPLDRFHVCIMCQNEAHKRDGCRRLPNPPPLANDDYIPAARRRAADFRRLGI